MSAENNFYTPVDALHFKDILEFLVHNQTEIAIKVGAQHFKSRILKDKNSRQFSLYKFNLTDFKSLSVICSFDIKGEKYFFTAPISSSGDDLTLDHPKEIYKLQRRNDFRVNVPASMSYTCEITYLGEALIKTKAEIRDISLGGMLIVARLDSNRDYKGEKLELNCAILDFDQPIIHCLVKRGVSLAGKIQLGVQFVDPSAAFLADLQSLLVYLDRLNRGKSYN